MSGARGRIIVNGNSSNGTRGGGRGGVKLGLQQLDAEAQAALTEPGSRARSGVRNVRAAALPQLVMGAPTCLCCWC